LEGLWEYEKSFVNNLSELREARQRGIEFLLQHRLFRSHKTGKVFDSKMTRLTFPSGWRYDIMRALDYIREVDEGKDERMVEAINIIIKKRGIGGVWLMQSRPPGKLFFEMENMGEPSRWNTLRALRILKWWER